MTRRDREASRRGSLVWWGSRRGEDGEAGQSLAEYVGAVGVVLLVAAIVFAGATPVGAQVRDELICAVSPILKEGSVESCGDGFDVVDLEGGKPDFPVRRVIDDEDGGYGPPTGDCEDDVTFDVVDTGGQWDTHVVQIGCVWYPVPTICASSAIPEGWFDAEPEDRVYLEDEIGEFVDCVTDGLGPPSDDPNDESCVNARPTSGEFDEDAPPNVQVGCKKLPVPKGCEEEWAAYEDAAPGKERAAASGKLANCMTEKYDTMEGDCVIEVSGHVDATNVSFLFFRWGESNGTLIEKLGDGRVRVHMLEGVETGLGASGDGVGGSPISFNVAGITGYTDDTTYEFTSMEDAQKWIDWYQEYDELSGVTGLEHCATYIGCTPTDRHKDRLRELAENEPEHHITATASVDTKKVKLSGGLTLEHESGPFALEGSVEGGYEGEVQIESREWSDGSYEVAYQSSDIGAFLVGAGIGGKVPFTKDKDGNEKTAGEGSASAQTSVEWKGTTRTTVIWGPDGELAQMFITMDDQVMATLVEAGVDLEAVLPYGFAVGGGSSGTKAEGTASVKEMIIDFNQHPELREKLGPKIDEIFPGGKDGNLQKDDVEIDGNDADGGVIYEATEEFGNVRELEYDASKTGREGHAGLTWQGLDLFKVEWTSVDEERILQESSFEVIDVDGKKQTTSPSPRCAHVAFEKPDDYYTDEFSAPGSDYTFNDNDSPKYTDGTYPGTDYDGDVPGDRDDLIQSLVDEYSADFPDKNILVVKDFDNFSFSFVTGFEHLATVDGMDVIALDGGTVTNNGDGGWINWGFTGEYDYDSENKIVKFT